MAADPRIIPLTFLYGVVADAVTAIYLNAAERYSDRPRATGALSIVYGCLGLFALLTMLSVPWVAGRPPILEVSAQAGTWQYVGWHAYAGIAILIYAWRSRMPDAAEPWKEGTFLRVALVNVSVVVACSTLALAFADMLPALIDGARLTGYRTLGVGALISGVDLVAALSVWMLPNRTKLDIALGLSALALALDAALNLYGGARFLASWYAARYLYVVASSVVLIIGIQTMIEARRTLAKQLAYAKATAARQGERLGSIWNIARAGDLGAVQMCALLEMATATLSVARPMVGILSHLERGNVVVDEVATCNLSVDQHRRVDEALFPRAAFPLAETLACEIYAYNKTMSWNDIAHDMDNAAFSRQVGFRSTIGTVFTPDATVRFLVFASPIPRGDEPFSDDDHAFVEVVAAFSASIIARQSSFDRMRHQIEHDALTGLTNRPQFRVAARSALGEERSAAIVIVEPDHFEDINRSGGYMLGDDVLVEIAGRLDAVEPDDLVARIGNSTFGFLLRAVVSEEQLRARVRRYAQCFDAPFPTGDRQGGKTLALTAALGVARASATVKTFDDVMHRAEFAMARRKRDERGTDVAFFTPDLDETFRRERTVRRELVDALERDEFTVLYQPTFDLKTRALFGAEALVRWDHPERGRIEPSDFIPFSERVGLIGLISRFVLSRVIADLVATSLLPESFRAYVNLSPVQFGDQTFLDDLRDGLERAPGIVDHLGVEVTESAAAHDVERAVQSLLAIKRLGLHVALDDFGTEYSALAHLKRFPIDVIKIDRVFVKGLPFDAQDAALCETLLSLARQFGAATLAEGVETAEQANWLLAHGCQYVQGFYFARPMPIDDLRSIVATENGRVATAG